MNVRDKHTNNKIKKGAVSGNRICTKTRKKKRNKKHQGTEYFDTFLCGGNFADKAFGFVGNYAV